MIAFRVFGTPRPQGSKRPLVTKAGRAIMIESSGEGLKTWRNQVAHAVNNARPPTPIDAPVSLAVRFFLPIPKKPRWPWPAKVPDLSKLVRGLEDELSGVVVTDDRLIVRLTAAKDWASDRNPPGAEVMIEQLAEAG